jgi:glycosyltransferase involved in cell wall biosynthesis
MSEIPHISVCVCTYKRLAFLKRLLGDLGHQRTEGRFTYSIVVADNDAKESAKPIVEEFAAASPVAIKYCMQPQQNIALTRNKAIENATGEYVAFVDDDEFPIPNWLAILLSTCRQYDADGVLGSAKPEFDGPVPGWVVKGKFYERATYPTGFVIDWRKGRTGNVLLKRELFEGLDQPFRADFLTGEDHDFFRRMIEKGRVFVWCDEALTYEVIPASRWKRSFMVRRALLRGKISLVHPTFGPRDVVKSALALPAYSVALPFLLLGGQHLFMNYLVRACDHAGRLLAVIGVDPIKEKYVTQ